MQNTIARFSIPKYAKVLMDNSTFTTIVKIRIPENLYQRVKISDPKSEASLQDIRGKHYICIEKKYDYIHFPRLRRLAEEDCRTIKLLIRKAKLILLEEEIDEIENSNYSYNW